MEARPLKEKKVWDKLAHRYDQQTARYVDTAYKLTIEAAWQAIAPGDAVLDIGCGTGIVTLGIAPYAGRSEAMIDVARAKATRQSLANVEFHVGDGYYLPHPDGSFEVVLLCNLLHVLQDPAAQLKDGLLITATDCCGEPARFPVRLQLWLQTLVHKLGVIPFLTNFTKADLRTLIQISGFQILETDDFYQQPVNYYVKAQKV